MDRRLTTSFVGRDAELAALGHEFDQALHGQCRIVVIDGEAGIGKSSLLREFVGRHAECVALRGSGVESEALVPFGLVRQLITGAAGLARTHAHADPAGIANDADPLDVADALVALVRAAHRVDSPLIVTIDDLPSADRVSTIAVLSALRQLHRDRVLGLFTARSDDMVRLGEGWSRFLVGDHRASRLRLTGLTRPDLVALGQALGAGRLSTAAVRRLIDYTSGNPLHCCALLEELDPVAWTRSDRLPAPRALSSVVLARLGSLRPETQRLVSAAGVLGRRCQLDAAARLAQLTDALDALDALDEASEAGILVEVQSGPATEIEFRHALIHSAVYGDLGSASRRRMHRAAAAVVGWRTGLEHRVAAATGPDDALADDLEAAARMALEQRRSAEAALWLAQASVASSGAEARDRRELDALEVLLDDGLAADAQAMLAAGQERRPSPRRTGLAGEVALLAGRPGEARASLTDAWEAHEPETEPAVGARAALLLAWMHVFDGRPAEAIQWAERAEAGAARVPSLRTQLLGPRALAAALAGQQDEQLAAAVASDGQQVDAHGLLARGLAKIAGDDLEEVLGDLSTAAARLQGGDPCRSISQCLGWLANVEYRSGAWDAAATHGRVAVELATAQDRVWDLAMAHCHAARVPAARGHWSEATEHVKAAGEAARSLRSAVAFAAWATARASLAFARGAHDDAVRAADEIKGRSAVGSLELSGIFDWRVIEVDALISVGDLQRARTALDALIAVGSDRRTLADALATARLAGNLANANGDTAGAELCFGEAWGFAARLGTPFELAQLELDDARRLRQTGRRAESIQRLRSARSRLEQLRAAPFVERCDRELAACGAAARSDDQLGTLGLSQAESAVARLVATGHTNREVANELYLSVKTVEFHLRNIFSKLDIRGRSELRARVGSSGRTD